MMKDLGPKIFSKLSNNPSALNLKFLSLLMDQTIPFNAPHGFKLQKISPEKVQSIIPYKRKNFNHIKGIHATALATIGEFVAGLCLLMNFKTDEYRFILAELNAKYHYQAKTDITAIAELPTSKLTLSLKDIKENQKTLIEMRSELYDKQKNHVATVTTTWQIKPWAQVKTKV
jgi:acyl-coenzyme A thioesterase PaaI-like protein